MRLSILLLVCVLAAVATAHPGMSGDANAAGCPYANKYGNDKMEQIKKCPYYSGDHKDAGCPFADVDAAASGCPFLKEKMAAKAAAAPRVTKNQHLLPRQKVRRYRTQRRSVRTHLTGNLCLPMAPHRFKWYLFPGPSLET